MQEGSIKVGEKKLDFVAMAQTKDKKRGPEEVFELTDNPKNGSHLKSKTDDELFSETLAWVRAKSSERRKKYRKKLKEKNDHYASHDDQPNLIEPSDEVLASLQRGRALLADADAHMKMFEQFLNPPKDESNRMLAIAQDTDTLSNRKVQDINIVGGGDHNNVRGARNATTSVEEIMKDASLTRRLKDTLDEAECIQNNENPHDVHKELTLSSFRSESNSSGEDVSKLPKHSNVIEKTRQARNSCDKSNTESFSVKKLMQESAARAKLDEIIASSRRRGDKNIYKHIDIEANISMGKLKLPKCSIETQLPPPFDPNKMRGAQRAAIKAAKRADAEAVADAETMARTNFKARPLPGGVWVQNDPYAPTQSAMEKRVQTQQNNEQGNQPKSKQRIPRGPIRMDASALLGRSQQGPGKIINSEVQSVGSHALVSSDTDISNALQCDLQQTHQKGNNEMTLKKERRQAERKARRKLFFDAVAVSIPENEEDSIEANPSDNGDQDISTLQWQIARMEADLKRKRIQCETTLDDIDDEDSLFDEVDKELVTVAEQSVSSKQPSDDGKTLIFSPFAEEDIDSGFDQMMGGPDGVNGDRANGDDSLYRRHEKWLEALERKRNEARLKKEEETMKSITGKPEIASAKESWLKAKEAHDAKERKVRAAEEEKSRVREEKDRMLQELKAKEINLMQKQAMKKRRAIKSHASKQKQVESLDKLSRPRNPKVVPCKNKYEIEISKENSVDGNIVAEETNRSGTAGHENNQKPEMCFADMDDKEFARVMKSLGIKPNRSQCGKEKDETRKKGKPTASDQRASSKFTNGSLKKRTNKDFIASDHSKLDHRQNERSTKDKNNDENRGSIEGGYIEGGHKNSSGCSNPLPPTITVDEKNIAGGRFTSSTAQANLLKKLVSSDQHERTVANVSSALEAAEIGLSELDKRHNNNLEEKDYGAFKILRERQGNDNIAKDEPYQRYEAGKIPFFDRSSSVDKGRFRVRDAKDFAPESMRRRPLDGGGIDDEGIMILVGKKDYEKDEGNNVEELAITILFDRSKFSEHAASEWWQTNRQRFIRNEEEEPP